MRDIAIFALIKGIEKASRAYAVSKDEVKLCIRNLNNDPFFESIKQLIWETLKAQGLESTSKIFCLSESTLIAFRDFHQKLKSEDSAHLTKTSPEIEEQDIHPVKKLKITDENSAI